METKEKLLKEIELLMGYREEESIIDPSLLAYLDEQTLADIKAKLLEKKDELSDDDKVWLARFRKGA